MVASVRPVSPAYRKVHRYNRGFVAVIIIKILLLCKIKLSLLCLLHPVHTDRLRLIERFGW